MFIKKLNNLFVLLTLVVTVTGCSKFLKTESENLAPFANQSISLVSSLNYGLSDNEILYLRKIDDYIDEDKPFERFDALENQVGSQLKALVTYSIQIVTISEQNISENEKSKELADILVTLSGLIADDEVIVDANKNVERNKEILAQVRASEDYLASLRILLPAINDFSAHALAVLDELEIEKRKVLQYLDSAIDRKYGRAIEFEQKLRTLRNSYYDSIMALSDYANTRDAKYLDELRAAGVLPVVEALKGKKSLTGKEMLSLHKVITERMDMVNKNYNQLKPDYDEYFRSHNELKKIIDAKDEGMKEARLTFIVWSRAYQKMALGKTDPAEWFDVSESGSLLMGAAGRAAGL
jgi:hypothetical protein